MNSRYPELRVTGFPNTESRDVGTNKWLNRRNLKLCLLYFYAKLIKINNITSFYYTLFTSDDILSFLAVYKASIM